MTNTASAPVQWLLCSTALRENRLWLKWLLWKKLSGQLRSKVGMLTIGS